MPNWEDIKRDMQSVFHDDENVRNAVEEAYQLENERQRRLAFFILSAHAMEKIMLKPEYVITQEDIEQNTDREPPDLNEIDKRRVAFLVNLTQVTMNEIMPEQEQHPSRDRDIELEP